MKFTNFLHPQGEADHTLKDKIKMKLMNILAHT